MQSIGTATFTDFDTYISFIAGTTYEQMGEIVKTVKSLLKQKDMVHADTDDSIIRRTLDEMSQVYGTVSSFPEKYLALRDKTLEKLRQFRDFAVDFEQPVNVGRWEDSYAYLFFGNPRKGIIVLDPKKYLSFTPAVDYSETTVSEMRALLGTSRGAQDNNLVPMDVETTLTTKSLREGLNAQNDDISKLKQQIEDTKDAKTGGLAEMKAQIAKLEQELYAKKEAMLAELKEKMYEMELMKEQMEYQIYILDSQIYAIRCYAGEIVNFTKILSGKNAPVTEPIVIHQKLRFLDEELGLLASLYEIEWEEMGMFENFLKHSPLALDTFVPNERCVTLVRLSRTGKQLGNDDRYPYQNMMTHYNYYHGKTVGIIIRNGENVYLGWTDEDRVHISDDLIVSQVITSTEPAKMPEFRFESDRERWEKQQREERKRLLDGVISRSFIYNILQGIVDNSPLLPLPDGVKLNKQSEYVIYAVADKWLTDNRFGSFNDIVDKVNQRVNEGDMLLTTQRLVAERERGWNGAYASPAWNNVRGRGERNRTHDVSADDCTLYPANVVEYDEPVRRVRFERLIKPDSWQLRDNPDAKPYYRPQVWNADDYDERKAKDEQLIAEGKATGTEFENDRNVEYYDYAKRHVFISLEKEDQWDFYGNPRSGTSRANFELYDGEYINLTYMNSVWLEWCITNRKLGGWSIAGNAVDYSYAIRYLKTAMDFVRKREAEEKALIDAVDPSVCEDRDWPLKLTEWKLEKNVRNITQYQAKRFVKHITNGAG